MTNPKIHCLYDDLLSPLQLKPSPVNRNKHPQEQIVRLGQIIAYQGFRYAVKVSKQSGYVVSGHGRIQAAIAMGWDKVPVVYQDYENSDQEYADMVADNAIASWAELDFEGINMDLADLSPDFNLDDLGIKNFKLDPSEKEENKKKKPKGNCPHCGESLDG